MANYKQIDLTGVRTFPIRARKSKVHAGDFAKVFDPAGGSFSAFVRSLPDILAAKDLRSFAGDIRKAVRARKPVIVMMGAHVVKVGLGPVLVDLIRRGVVSCVAMNGAAAIHDVETAMWGMTSEDVEETIADGRFGMSRETGEFINGTIGNAMVRHDCGYGESLGRALRKAPNRKLSILAACYSAGVPVTVHAAIGTDIIHQQPSMDGAETGEMTFRDFKVLCNVVKKLNGGGVVMNLGSAVIMPEVFLKALTVARNLGRNVRGFTTANFDMIQHYRPRMNVISRPTKPGGRGYMFTGHHEIMIPLLAAMVKELLKR